MQIRLYKYEYYKQLAIAYKNAAKLMRCVAAIHVEASEDKIFWERTFKAIEPDFNFHFITYTRTKDGGIATGCTTCLSYKDFLSKEFFVCIDSDYRYLLMEKNINVKHAIFQTYAYSIENHYCYANGINDVFESMGLKNDLFDFEAFLISYSKILYELFIYHLYSLSQKDGIFTKDDFKMYISIERLRLPAENILNHVKSKVDHKIPALKKAYPDLDIEILKEKYAEMGVREENAYLYFRGHNVFERVILPITKEVRKILEQKYVESFSSEEKKKYFSQSKDLKSYFQENIPQKGYPEMRKIEKDFNLFFKQNLLI